MNREGMNGVISEKQIIIQLLDLYKDFPLLWDSSHKDYHNQEARNESYNVMLELFKKYDSEVTIKTLKKKLDNMRTSYKREKKKVQKSKATGAATAHTPMLWYYKYLSFLDEKSDSAIDGCDNLDDVVEIEEPAKKKKKAIKVGTPLVTPGRINENAQRLSNPREESSAWAFGRSVASQLKELPKLQRCLAEKLMGEIIFYAKLDQLNVNTTINLNREPQSINYSQQSHYAPFYASSLHNSPLSLQCTTQYSQDSSDSSSPFSIPHQSSPSPCHSPPLPRHSYPSRRRPMPSRRRPTPSTRRLSPSPRHSPTSPRQQSPSPRQPSPRPHQPPSSPHSSSVSLNNPSLQPISKTQMQQPDEQSQCPSPSQIAVYSICPPFPTKGLETQLKLLPKQQSQHVHTTNDANKPLLEETERT